MECGLDIDVSMEIFITQHGKPQYKMLVIDERQEKTLNPNARRPTRHHRHNNYYYDGLRGFWTPILVNPTHYNPIQTCTHYSH